MNELLPPSTCMGYSVFSGNLSLLLTFQKALLINTINQYSHCVAEKDAEFKKALQESDVLLPDGVGIVAAEKILNGRKISKITGADLHQYLLDRLHEEGGSCFYLGSSEDTLTRIRARMAAEYPAIRVGSFSPPYKPAFDEADNEQMLAVVNDFKPDVLFIGMTAPKQEKWAYNHKNELDTKIICSVGAVFDFFAGTVNRPHKVLVNLGLEWFGRLVKEPKRMWKRYLYYGPLFIYFILKEKARQKLNDVRQSRSPKRKFA